MRSIPYLTTALCALVACGGDDAPADPDAPAMIDATPDSPSVPAGCDYAELQDATNDDLSTSANDPETTGKTLATSVRLCGQIDTTHYTVSSGLVDVDGYAVTVPAGPIRVTVSGPGLEALRDVTLELSNGVDFADHFGGSELLGTHVFYMETMEAGLYQFAVIVGNATAPAAPIPYKIVITADDPAARCPKVTAAASFTEAGDGAGSRGNDVYGVNFSATAPAPVDSLTTAVDTSELTTLTINPADVKRLSGSLAEIAVDGSYKDRDSFVFTTGANTDEVTLRVNWTGTADLDAFLFEAGTVPRVGQANITSTTESEYQTIAVKPSTMYAVWAGLYKTSTGPIAYDISLCGSDFEHPTN